MWNHFKKLGKQYYLTDWEGNLLQQMETVGLVFHVRPNKSVVLVGYGQADMVRENFNWKPKTNGKLFIFEGQFQLDDLNVLISDETYAEVFYAKLKKDYENERNNI